MARKKRQKNPVLPPQIVPVFNVPYPPVRHVREDEWAKDGLPAYRPYSVETPEAQRLSMAQAAFRLGHLGLSIWNRADVLWFHLALRNYTPQARRGRIPSLRPWGWDLLDARRVLAESMSSPAYERLPIAIDSFVAIGERAIAQYREGTFNPDEYKGGRAPWEELWRDLARWCERALSEDHVLRPLFELGVAFGRFSLAKNEYCEHICGIHEYDKYVLPEIGEMASKASAIRVDALARSPLLTGLARIGRRYDQLGNPRALAIYYRVNRRYWAKPQAKITYLEAISDLEWEQALKVEEDLAGIPDEAWTEGGCAGETTALELIAPVGPRSGSGSPPLVASERRPATLDVPTWDHDDRELSYRGIVIRKVDAKGDNIVEILDAFQKKAWVDEHGRPIKIENPLTDNSVVPLVDRLQDAAKTLNRRIYNKLIKFNIIDSSYITWSRSRP